MLMVVACTMCLCLCWWRCSEAKRIVKPTMRKQPLMELEDFLTSLEADVAVLEDEADGLVLNPVYQATLDMQDQEARSRQRRPWAYGALKKLKLNLDLRRRRRSSLEARRLQTVKLQRVDAALKKAKVDRPDEATSKIPQVSNPTFKLPLLPTAHPFAQYGGGTTPRATPRPALRVKTCQTPRASGPPRNSCYHAPES